MKIYILLVSVLLSTSLFGQRVLYFEEMAEVKAKKYYEGQRIDIKLKEYPDEWISLKIEKLLPEEKVILSTNGMYDLDEVSHIRRERKWVGVFFNMTKTLAFSGAVLGSLGAIRSGEAGEAVAAVVLSGISFGVGWLTNKLLRYRTYKIGKKYRLKILDLSFPSPQKQPLIQRL